MYSLPYRPTVSTRRLPIPPLAMFRGGTVPALLQEIPLGMPKLFEAARFETKRSLEGKHMEASSGQIEAKLAALGCRLPDVPAPVGAYVPAVRTGNLVFLSGQGPFRDGGAEYAGKVGSDFTVEEAYEIARQVALRALAVLKQEIGTLDKVRRIVKLVGWVNSAPGFTQQPKVINGASDLLHEVFGERGQHARSAVGAAELPLNIPVEIEMVVEVEP